MSVNVRRLDVGQAGLVNGPLEGHRKSDVRQIAKEVVRIARAASAVQESLREAL